MLFDSNYFTVLKESEGVFSDRGSKFIGIALPFSDLGQLKDLLQSIKDRYPKANHYTYAYRFSLDKSVFRANDDGEPSGTAGRQILNVLLSKNLTNVLVVVVRYFGGTLLGVPGLINAYKTTAELALDKAMIVEKSIFDIYVLKVDFQHLHSAMQLIKENSMHVLENIQGNEVQIEFEFPKDLQNKLVPLFENIEGLDLKFKKSGM